MQYSNSFQTLVSDSKRLKQLFAGSSFGAPDLSGWEGNRKFIAQAINQSGTILDIGCGNGFLLRCLQEWQDHSLTPYGIDTNENFITQAKLVFPNQAQNFTTLSIENLDQLTTKGMPDKYNLIYWNVWDNWNFNSDRHIEILKNILTHLMPVGRLILGLYYTESQYNLDKINQLNNHELPPNGTLQNPNKWEIICWFDK